MGTDRMQMPRALITGATGFAGSHLADLCLASGWEVHGTSLEAPEGRAGAAVSMHQLELSEPGAFERVLTAVLPDRIFHLAGQASVATAWADPAATLIGNIVTTQRVLEAAHVRSPEARLLIVSSGEVYGRPPLEVQPIREAQPLRPADPYAVSKVSVEYLALQHVLAFGMHVVRVRPFNHIGPRQRRGFVVADFAAQIAAIERGLEAARAHGAAHVILGHDRLAAEVKRITGGAMVPVVYDSVGKDTFGASLDCLAPLGLMVTYGNSSGPVPPVDLGVLSAKGSLFLTRPTLATYTASRADLTAAAAELMDAVSSGVVKIRVNQTFPLKNAADAHRALEARQTTGSTVLIP